MLSCSCLSYFGCLAIDSTRLDSYPHPLANPIEEEEESEEGDGEEGEN